MGLGAALSAIGVLSVVWLVGAAGERQQVLAVRRDVPYGAVIAADDLMVVRVSVDPGVSVLAAGLRSSVVGQVATTRLVPGMLLAHGMAEPDAGPPPGRVFVPVAIEFERMPAGGLRAGDRILAVVTDEAEPVVPIRATVVRVGPTDVNGTTVVDVSASEPDGSALAIASATGRVAIAVESVGR